MKSINKKKLLEIKRKHDIWLAKLLLPLVGILFHLSQKINSNSVWIQMIISCPPCYVQSYSLRIYYNDLQLDYEKYRNWLHKTQEPKEHKNVQSFCLLLLLQILFDEVLVLIDSTRDLVGQWIMLKDKKNDMLEIIMILSRLFIHNSFSNLCSYVFS